MNSASMRSVGSKSFGFKIELMKWSNRMDLLAFSNEKGEVIVQRLNWQNLWIHPPPAENIKVRGIDWRPDERILVIGYSTGLVVLLDVEHHQEVNTFQLDSDITCLSWTQNVTEIQDEVEDFQKNRLFQNSHEVYLPPLPSFNALSSNARKADYNSAKSYSSKVFNILTVGLKSGLVHMSVFGVLPCGRIDVTKHLKVPADQFQILDVKMSVDFRLIYVVIRLRNKLKILVYENETIPSHAYPLLNLAAKHGHILNTMAYIEDIIQCITEAWETALLEMDNKLTKYASSQPDGTVSADFLELLMFGYPSSSLQRFLTRDLTEKGLKKLGNSIEISYSTIQQLVVKPLHTGLLNITYHLNCIMGMSKNVYYYKAILGKLSNDVVLNNGAFLIKSLELQQSIEQSTRDYKIFWVWLYGVIIRLMEESVPDEFSAVTQQDVIYLAEFLNNFDKNYEMGSDNTVIKRKFNLERVGQYLDNKNLQTQSKNDLTSEWNKLLQQNECLRKSDVIYPHHRELSLVQEHNKLKASITELFSKPEKLIGDSFKFKTCIDFANVSQDTDEISTHHINDDADNCCQFIVTIGNKLIHFIEFDPKSDFIKMGVFEFQQTPFQADQFNICHMQFYNESTISMLLKNTSDDQKITNCFIQFPVQSIQIRLMGYKVNELLDLTKSVTVSNLYDVLDPHLVRGLELADGQTIAVSGSRKMASILSASGRRIRHYEMEVEEEDDEIDMSQTNNSLDISKDSTQSV